MVKQRHTPPGSRPPTNLRKHHQQTERRLIWGGFAILVVVGGALVWLLYGPGAMLASLACLGGGIGLFGLLYLFLKLIELWVNSE